MLASLGNITFEAPNTPVAMSGEHEVVLAEHALIEGKPRLQRTGSALKRFSIEIILRPQFTNPEASILALEGAKEASTVLPFVLGNGQYIGNFVIKRTSQDYVKTLSDGSILEARVAVELIEYASDSLQPVAQAVALASAFARAGNQPVTTPDLTPEFADGAVALDSVRDIRTTTSRVNRLLRTAQQIEERRAATFATVTASVQSMNASLTTAREIVTAGAAVIRDADDALAALNDVEAALTTLDVSAGLENITTAAQAGIDLESAVRSADLAFSGLASMVVTRRYA